MSRRYDQSTTTFSPEGRLHQVEYAIEAINNAGTCVGLQCGEGVVLAAERRVVSKLLAPSKTSEKTYVLDAHAACLVAGLTADANILIHQARIAAQRYLYDYQEPMPIANLVKSVCNYKQAYTQYGGLRPFGVAFVFAGWDAHSGFQVYQSDPSGNYSGWKATVIGQNNQTGKGILKTDYKTEGGSLQDNVKLAVKIIMKTMDSSAASAERIEVSVLRKRADVPGAANDITSTEDLELATLPDEEVRALIEALQKEAEAEQKAKEAATADI